MKKRKLLLISEAMGGGVFTYLVELTGELAAEYDVTLAYAVRPQTPADFQTYFDPRVRLVPVRNFCRQINPLRELAALREVRQLVRLVQPDIIHLHSSKAGVIGRLALCGGDIPVFYTPHGYSFLMQNYSTVRRSFYRFLEKLSARRQTATVCCSYGEYLETLKLTHNACYIDNFIRTEDLQAIVRDVPTGTHPFTVFTVGRICYQKNPAMFNRIASALPEVRFLWIGDGEDRALLTSPNIHVTGWMDRKSALSIAVNGDAFLLPSLWEGMPVSLLEAMYLQKVCVVSNVIGNRDVIHDGQNGFVCDTLTDYCAAIEKIRTGQAQPFAVQAQADVLTRHELHTQARCYSRLYQQFLPKSQNGDPKK